MRGKTVLFIGAGRHQRRAIERVQELGVRVVAVDGNPDAPGLQLADAGEAVDFTDVEAVAAVGRAHSVDGVMTVAAGRTDNGKSTRGCTTTASRSRRCS